MACLALCISSAASAQNPVGFAYSSTYNVEAFSAPTAMLVTGPCNRYAAKFATARDAGAEVLTYLNPVDVPAANPTSCHINTLERDFFMGDVARVPRWGRDADGQWRVNYRQPDGTPTFIADIRAGSSWPDHVVSHIEQLMVENRVDGVFLDILGGRLWSNQRAYDTDGNGQVDTILPLSRWGSWPTEEQNAYTSGAVDLIRRLDASRRRLNPDFLLVNNQVWVWNFNSPGLGAAGEQYVDGVCLENPSSSPTAQTPQFHVTYAGRTFSNLGHRRVLVIETDKPDTPEDERQIARDWASVPGVTHVTGQLTYARPGDPVVGTNPLHDRVRPHTFGKTSYAAGTDLLRKSIKTASRFTFTRGGRVLRFGAYLNGQGDSTGSTSVRIVLYTNNVTDNVARPQDIVVQSADVTVQFGQPAGWVSFPVTSNVSIAPGDYWIAIHAAGAKGRQYVDGPDNCFSKGDLFEDGTSHWGPATGTACTGTLTVYTMIAD